MVVNFYIDGFNLYYRALKGTPYRWLDLASLCEKYVPRGGSVGTIHYFTARVNDDRNPGTASRQDLYLRALGTIPHLRVEFGLFRTRRKRLPRAAPRAGERFVEVLTTEEKGSDVNLATALLVDAYEHRFETAVVVSNDSDLIGPVRAVRDLGLRVGVLNPDREARQSALTGASFYKQIRSGPLRDSQFPDELSDSSGVFARPPRWSQK